jgi:hypothetical protein
MEKKKRYCRTIFPADCIAELIQAAKVNKPIYQNLSAQSQSQECWSFDTLEDFLPMYQEHSYGADIILRGNANSVTVHVSDSGDTNVTIGAKTRAEIEATFQILERRVASSILPPRVKPARHEIDKSKDYERVVFSADCIREAILAAKLDMSRSTILLQVQSAPNERWNLATIDEFLSMYRTRSTGATLSVRDGPKQLYLRVNHRKDTTINVGGETRAEIESIFEIFEKRVAECMVPPALAPKPEPPIVFIGHGQSMLWRDLKDHLHDQHEYSVQAYETGARAGHGIRDILASMMSKSSIAFLVMTAEDETSTGRLRARQNVVHELGLFQGKLGFNRGIMVLQQGTEEFSATPIHRK